MPSSLFRAHHCLSAVLFALVMLCAVHRDATAQAENLKVSVESGFSGEYRAGAWVPIMVTITNQPPADKSVNDIEDFKGQLTVTSAPQESGQEPIQFVRSIDVPKASSKRFALFAKFAENIPTGRTPGIRLNTQNGKYLAEYALNLKAIPKDRLLMATISQSSMQVNLPRMRDQFVDAFVYASMAPDLLSDHWAGMDSADVIVFPSWPAKGLRPEVVEALRQWVQMGGTLVFATGKEAQTYADEESKKLLPVTMKGTKRLEERGGTFSIAEATGSSDELKDGKSYIVCDAEAGPDTEVLLAAEGVPLVARARVGKGQVVYFACDLQSASRNLERYLMPAWQSIAPIPNLTDSKYELSGILEKFQTLTGRAARPPNQFIIILICIAYTVIVGPINFAVLGKRKKLELAWITVPVIVLIFFFLIYGMGRLTKGNNDIVREVRMDEFDSASVLGKSTTIIGTFVSNPSQNYFRPARNQYALSDSFRWDDYDSFRGRQGYGRISSSVTSAVTSSRAAPVITYESRSGHLYISSVDMGTFDARNFIARGPVDRPGVANSDPLVWHDGWLAGTVKNDSGYDYEEAWIAAGNGLLKIGPLKNGQTFTLDQNAMFEEYAKRNPALRLSNRVFENAENVFAGLRQNDPETDAEVNHSNFGLMMSSSFSPKDTGDFFPPRAGEVLLIGYTTVPKVAEETTNVRPTIQSGVHATVTELTALPPKGEPFTITDSYLKKSLVTFDASTPGQSFEVDPQGVTLHNSIGVICVELPFSHPRLHVRSFHITPTTKIAETQDFALEVFHWGERPGWEPMEQISDVPNSDVVLPVSGRMYIRLKSQDKKNPNGSVATMWNATSEVSQLNVSISGIVDK